jgi:hypothetical protein
LSLAWPGDVLACNVPVFRYALERWAADAYEIVVFHDGTLRPEQQKLLASLADYVDTPEGCPSNITLEVVNTQQKMAEDLAQLFDAQKKVSLPWMVVRFPRIAKIPTEVYAGPLDSGRLKRLLDSPARRQVAEKLLEGQTAVWIMIDSGNGPKDEQTARWLQERLADLERTLKLPELTQEPKDKLRVDVPLKIEFSFMRLSRKDVQEVEFVRMLLRMEDDLEDRDEPIVYPVFGRGLALWAIVGKGITEENVGRAAKFLVGPCSCEIKAQNPGVDLLLTADWEERLTTRITKAPELPPLASLFPESSAGKAKDVKEKNSASRLSYYEAPGTSRPPESLGSDQTPRAGAGAQGANATLWRNLILALAGGLALVAAASICVYARRKT